MVSLWVTLLWSTQDTTLSHVTVTHDFYCFCQHSHFTATHLKPDQAKPLRPTAMVRQVTAPAGVSRNAARSMNAVWLMNALQLNSFCTCYCITISDSYSYHFNSWVDSNTAVITEQIVEGKKVNSTYSSYNKTNEMHYFLKYIFVIELYMFQTGFLFVISSLVLYKQQ
jgi:hypothetical protein